VEAENKVIWASFSVELAVWNDFILYEGEILGQLGHRWRESWGDFQVPVGAIQAFHIPVGGAALSTCWYVPVANIGDLTK